MFKGIQHIKHENKTSTLVLGRCFSCTVHIVAPAPQSAHANLRLYRARLCTRVRGALALRTAAMSGYEGMRNLKRTSAENGVAARSATMNIICRSLEITVHIVAPAPRSAYVVVTAL